MKPIYLLLFCFGLSFTAIGQVTNRVDLMEPGQPLTEKVLSKVSKATSLRLQETEVTALLRSRPASIEFQLDGPEPLVLELQRSYPLDPGFTVKQAAAGGTVTVPYERGTFYHGHIKGKPQSVVAISIFEGSVLGLIQDEQGTRNLVPLRDAKGAFTSNHILYFEKDLRVGNEFTCTEMGAEDYELPALSEKAANYRASAVGFPISVYAEIDLAAYTANGSNITTSINWLAGIFNSVSLIYAIEDITLQLREVKVWTTTDPYATATNTSNALSLFATQMSPGFNGDLATLISTRGLGGGIAYLSSLCASNNIRTSVNANMSNSVTDFPVYSWNVMVVTHEFGHNLGSRHTQWCGWPGGAIDNCFTTEGGCPQGPPPINGGTIMSYCHTTSNGINLANGFGPLPGNAIRTLVGSRTCNNTCGNLTVQVNKTDIGCGSTTGSAAAVTNGGTGPFSYWWTTGATTSSVTGLTPGRYYVEVTGSPANCKVITGVNIRSFTTVSAATRPVAGTYTACGTNGTFTMAATEWGTGFTYQWNLNGNPIGGATSQFYRTNISGVYTVTVRNGTCTTTSGNITLNLGGPTPTATASGATTFCAGGSVVLQTATVTGGTYQWFNGTTAIAGATSNSFFANTSGAYSVRVTQSTCTGTSNTINVTVNGVSAVATAAGPTSFCSGGSVVLNANAASGVSYQWTRNGTDISGATTASFTATQAGDYRVRITQGACTSLSAPVTVSVSPSVTASLTAGGPVNVCEGTNVTLNLNSNLAGTYQWFRNGVLINGANGTSYTANTGGDYTATVTAGSCSGTTNPITVVVRPAPAATVTTSGSTTFCQGGSVTLTVSSTAGANLQWLLNGSPISGQTNTSLVVSNTSGTYSATATLNGCTTNSVNTAVTVQPRPTVTVAPVTAELRKGRSITITASGALNYNWNAQPNVVSSTTNTAVVSPGTSTTYTITGTAQNGCTSTATSFIKIIGCGDATNLRSQVISPGRVQVQWNNPPGVTTDTLQYKAVTDASWKSVFVRGESYIINGLRSNTEYMFRVVTLCPTSDVFFFNDTAFFKTKALNGVYIRVIPNPASTAAAVEVIQDEAYQDLSVAVYDQKGRLIQEVMRAAALPAGQLLQPLPVERLQAGGVYYCVVRMNGKRHTVRFVKN